MKRDGRSFGHRTLEAIRLMAVERVRDGEQAATDEVYFWNESGFRADAMHGKTWGLKEQTPVVERPGQR
jgi:hypothetical protein